MESFDLSEPIHLGSETPAIETDTTLPTKGKKKLVFFFRKKQHIGGSFIFLLSMARIISERDDYDVYYVNFRNSRLDNIILDSKVHFCDVDAVDYRQFEGADFVLPLNYLLVLLERVKDIQYGRILIYDWHPNIIGLLNNQFYYRKRNIKPILELFKDKNALAFMDKGCYSAFCNWYKDDMPDPQYVPVFLYGEKKAYIPIRPICENRVNVGWIGRLDSDKIYSLINFLDNLIKLQLDIPIDIHIIGDGDARNLINIQKYAPKIRFIFTSYLLGDVRDQYICENVDLMVALGIAALDTANLSIPTVIPMVSPCPFRDNKYVFLFDTKDYSLGWGPRDIGKLGYQTYTLSEVISLVYTGCGKECLGWECWEYCHDNFDCEKSGQMLLNALENTELTFSDCWNNPQIERQMRNCELYTKLRKNRTYEEYVQLIQKFNKLQNKNLWTRLRGMIKILIAPIPKAYKKIRKKVKDRIDLWKRRRKNLKLYLKVQEQYPGKIEKICAYYKERKRLRALFLVMYSATFPTEPIFQKMLQDLSFDAYIMVIPDMQRSAAHRCRTYTTTYEELVQKYGDRVLHGADLENNIFFEPGDSYQLAFFNNPYIRMAHKFHHVTYFLDMNVLTFYVNYGFAAVKYGRIIMDTNFYNLIWRVCLDSEINRRDVKRYEPLKGKNALVTGYLKMDRLSESSIYSRKRKRIIISPHHTVLGWKALDISNFLTYSEFFIELPKLYPQIDFVFRPHQLLFSNLTENNIWTWDTVEDYLARMLASPNIEYDTAGDYFELFANSDGMIHDCSSFIGEYLFTEKPCCYMLKSKKQIQKVCNPMGMKCMQQYYKAFSKEDIIKFLDEVILCGNDPLKEKREEFVRKELKFNYPHAADTVLQVIKNTLYMDEIGETDISEYSADFVGRSRQQDGCCLSEAIPGTQGATDH